MLPVNGNVSKLNSHMSIPPKFDPLCNPQLITSPDARTFINSAVFDEPLSS